MQKACNYCDNQQQINLEKNDATGKWIATNLDGSIHKHVKYNAQPQPQPQQQETVTTTTTPTPSQPNNETREQAIERMHNENITTINNLTKAINNLTRKWTGIIPPDEEDEDQARDQSRDEQWSEHL